MSKAILIFINIIGFLYLTILNIKKTEITHNGPKQIEIGQELEVNIIINKNDFSGPGRLRLDLSEAKGIEVIEKNSNGASFTFKNNEVLFIWYDLPNNQNIEISYLIKTNENISSMNKISGDFSFVNKDERKQLDIPELTFEVKGDELATVKEDENKSGIVITRNIMKIDSGYIVTIKTQLEDHKGFARIKDVLPMNIEEYGNSSVATVPTLFDLVKRGKMENQEINKGDVVILASVGAGMNINAIVYKY